eukprot:1933122-Alexandrium_andersonii.AAC.1
MEWCSWELRDRPGPNGAPAGAGIRARGAQHAGAADTQGNPSRSCNRGNPRAPLRGAAIRRQRGRI